MGATSNRIRRGFAAAAMAVMANLNWMSVKYMI